MGRRGRPLNEDKFNVIKDVMSGLEVGDVPVMDKQTKRNLKALIKRGYITSYEFEGSEVYKLTEKGRIEYDMVVNRNKLDEDRAVKNYGFDVAFH